MKVRDAPSALVLHDQAHHRCFVANSVRTRIDVRV